MIENTMVAKSEKFTSNVFFSLNAPLHESRKLSSLLPFLLSALLFMGL